MLVLIIEFCGMVVRLPFLGWQIRKAERRADPFNRGSPPMNEQRLTVRWGGALVPVSHPTS